MVSLLRAFPNQLFTNTFKLLTACRYISKIDKTSKDFITHENVCKSIKQRTKLGKYLYIICIL